MKIPNRITCSILLLSCCLAPPIQAGKVKAFTASHATFPQYKTFRWFPPRVLTKVGVIEDHPANSVLKEIVVRELTLKGLTEVAEDGDLQVYAFVTTTAVPQLEAVIFGEGYRFEYGTTVATMGRYNHEGTLYLNLIDSRVKKSAWFAMVSDSIPRGTLKPDEIRSKLDKAATNIFKKYPAKK